MPTDTEKLLPETWTAQLKREVKEFRDLYGMEYATIGGKAVANPRAVTRLIAGGTITLRKADELRAWMLEQSQLLKPKGETNV
jgi:hypothetical protein